MSHRRVATLTLLTALLPALLGVARLSSASTQTASFDPPAAPPAPPDNTWTTFGWRFDGQAYVYGSALARGPNSAINPGNTYVRVPNFSLIEELRPNVRGTSEYLDVVSHPRLTSEFESGGVAAQETVRGYFQEAYARLKPTQNVSVTAGRELLTWGPAFFRSPSNPYYFNNARVNPIIELSGLDLARATYSHDSDWTVTGGIVMHSGHDLVANDAYKDSLLLKADYTGPDYTGSVIVASKRGQSTFFGGYAQATINEAILAYGELGASSAERAIDAASSTLTPTSYNSRRSATALFGGSYTFQDGTSLYAEYLYNGFGYDRGGERNFFTQARQLGLESQLGGGLSGVAGADLGGAATRSQNLLGQHYIYLQYQNNPAQGNTLWRLMAAHNVTDHSTQFSGYLERNITERVSLFAFGVVNTGSNNSEFPAVFRASFTAGAKVFLF